jgi:two-component system, LytTR family, response regulator
MKRETKRIRVVVGDADAGVRDTVRNLLAGQQDMQVIAECVSADEVSRAIQAYRPELVVLAADLPIGGARAVIERVGPDRMAATVFLAGDDEHTVRGLDAHALRYLRKPVDGQQAVTLFDDVRISILGGAATDRAGEKLADYLANATPTQPGAENEQRLTRFMIRERDRIRFIAAEDVDWIEGARNYVRLHVGERSHLLRGPLTAILAQLDPSLFARIHRSIIVNTDRIREVQPWVGGDYVAILKSGERLRVSRNFRETVVRSSSRMAAPAA